MNPWFAQMYARSRALYYATFPSLPDRQRALWPAGRSVITGIRALRPLSARGVLKNDAVFSFMSLSFALLVLVATGTYVVHYERVEHSLAEHSGRTSGDFLNKTQFRDRGSADSPDNAIAEWTLT